MRHIHVIGMTVLFIGHSLISMAQAGTLEFDGVPVDITTSTNEDLVIVPGIGGNTQIGDGAGTNTQAITNDDIHVTGVLEVDGVSYFDGGAISASHIVPDADAIHTLGTLSKAWANLYVDWIGIGVSSSLSGVSLHVDGLDVVFELDAAGDEIKTGLGQQSQVTISSNLDQDDVLIKRDVDGQSSYTEAGSLLKLDRDVTNVTTESGVHLEFADSDAAAPAQLLNSTVADSSSAVGFAFDTTTALTTSGANLFEIKTGGTTKFSIDKDGTITAGGGGSGTSFTAAGDTGINQLISGSDTLTISGGTNLTSTAGATDTITVSLDDSISLNGTLTLAGTGTQMNAGANTIGFTQQTVTPSGGAATIDWRNGNKARITLNQNVTFTFTAPSYPCNILLILVQDATGSRTVVWPAAVRWPEGTAPILSAGANAIDIVTFYFDGTNYYGMGSLNFS